MNLEIKLNGAGYTQTQALAMKEEILGYANANNLKGLVIIAEPL